jgi:translation initiation factor 1
MTKKSGGNPWTVLTPLRDQLPSKPLPDPKSEAKPPPKPPARAVVRMERKQRGGKEVTVIDKLGLAPAQLEIWCKELKSALGCGGMVDGETIVLQGDLRARIEPVLVAKGVAKVTIAN